MERRTGFSLAFACSAILFGSLTPTDAHACSEPGPPDQTEPCVTLTVNTPYVSFPMNVVDEITLEHMDQDEYQDHTPAAAAFPSAEEIEVVRETPDGFEPLEFELLADPEGRDHVRVLSIVDPEAGHHVITWLGETCRASESPTGNGVMIREFDITEEIAVPTSVGTLTASSSTLVVDEYHASDEGDCYPENEGTTVIAQSSVSLSLESDVIPWADVVELGVRVDGEPHPTITKLAAHDIKSGVVSFDLKRVCSTDTQSGAGPQFLSEGAHVVTVHGRFGDAELETEPAAFTISCAGADEKLEEAQGDGGCSVTTLGSGSREHAPWAFVAAAAMLVAYRRRRASRRSPTRQHAPWALAAAAAMLVSFRRRRSSSGVR